MINFKMTAADLALRDRTRAFVREQIVPFEQDARLGSHGPSDDLRRELNHLARDAGLLAPHVSPHYGGLGLSHVQRAIVFEAAGYSMLGPVAMHCAAPDEGNMHMLELVANEAQKERYLRPLATAQVRSCFAMTEPHPGAGADPGQLATRADKDGGHFVINGEKWLITGAQDAGFAIIMARAFEGEQEIGPTMFFVPLPQSGFRIDRIMNTIDSSFTGGHGHIQIENLRVPASDVLGEVGQGLKYAQIRLAPARLTHCMRWLGAAQRAHDIASAYAAKRTAFGKTLIEHEGVGFMLADNEIAMHMCRLAILDVAWRLDQGEPARHESSMAKVFVSEQLYQVVDRCVQVLGGSGVTDLSVVEKIFKELRAFRIYDGPSEVHRWAIANRVARQQKPRH